MPVIGVIEASNLDILENQWNQGIVSYRKGYHISISLIEAKNDVLSSSSSASFAFAVAPVHGLIHLNLTGRHHLMQLFHGVTINGLSKKPYRSAELSSVIL
jgi:hypothetical protein